MWTAKTGAPWRYLSYESDALGNPMKFILTGGEQADCLQELPLLEGETANAVPPDKLSHYRAFRKCAESENMPAAVIDNIPSTGYSIFKIVTRSFAYARENRSRS
jgi:hypothetical protein